MVERGARSEITAVEMIVQRNTMYTNLHKHSTPPVYRSWPGVKMLAPRLLVLILISISIASTAKAQLTPEVEYSEPMQDPVSDSFTQQRKESGKKTFNRIAGIWPFRLSVMLSFDDRYDIREIIDLTKSYSLRLIGFHAHPGGSTIFSPDADPEVQLDEYRQSMLQMTEIVIDSLSEMSGTNVPGELAELKALQDHLLKGGSIEIIGIDVKGRSGALKNFISDHPHLASGIELIFPGRRMAAIPPEGW